MRIFENQLYRKQTEEPLGLNKDLLAIRMASVNPILDPWIYILLRKTVVLKLMEKIKCLFCKMGGRVQRRGGQFRCDDGRLSSSIVSRDSPSLVSRELQEMVNTSQTFLYPSEDNTGTRGGFNPRVRQTLQSPEEDNGALIGRSQCHLEDTATAKQLPMSSNSALHVTLTDETANTQERCI